MAPSVKGARASSVPRCGLDRYSAAVAELTLPQDQARFDDISRLYGITVPPPDTPPPPPR